MPSVWHVPAAAELARPSRAIEYTVTVLGISHHDGYIDSVLA